MLRSNSRPRLRLAAAGLALCGGLAAATPALAATGSPAGQLAVSVAKHGPSTLVVGDNGAVDTLNPYNGFTSLDFEVYGNIYDNLMDYGQLDYSGTPRLATSWSHTPDGLTWTYHIRKGVKWSDGVPLTAADVAYTFTRDIQPGSVEQADNSAYVGNITSAKATGPYTVVMKVSKPSPVMNRLIVFILPQHIWKHVSEKQVSSFQNTNPVGSGPFVVTSFHVNQSVTLKANPHYWGGKPGISGLVFQKYTNPSAEAIDLRNGRIGFAEDLTNALFKSLKDASGVTLNDAPSGNWDELAFNNGAATVAGKKIGNGNPALLDVNVRHAISYSLDLRLFLRSDSAQEVQAGQYIKGWLNAIGIGVSVTSMSDSTLTQDIGNGNYDMFIWGWGVEPNPDFQLSVFTCGQRSSGGPPNYTPGWSDSFFCDQHYDQLYAQQKTLDGPARAKVVKQMQQKLYADDPYSLLYYYDDTQAYRSDQFTGFAPQPNNPHGLLLFQEVSWWSYRCLRPVGTSPSLTDKNIGCAHEMGIAAANQQATSAGSGVSGAMIGGIAAAVVVLAAAGLLLARRRSVTTAD